MSQTTFPPLQQCVDEFVRVDVVPSVGELDSHNIYPVRLLHRMAELGLLGLTVPREFGGLEASLADAVDVFRRLSRGWLSLPALLGSHLRVCAYINSSGSPAQKAKWLPRLAGGQLIAAHAFREGTGDTRAADLLTRLTGEGPFLLHGKKPWVTNVRHADIIAVVCATTEGPAVVIIDRTRPGVQVGEDLPRMGIRGVSLASLTLDGCPVEIDDVVFEPDSNAQQAIRQVEGQALLFFAARAVGASEELLEACRSHCSVKLSAGRTLATVQTVQHDLGQAWARVEAARAYLDRCSAEADLDVRAAGACKALCCDLAQDIAMLTMRLHGAVGYLTTGVVERHMRDILSLSIVGSPSATLYTNAGEAWFRNKPH